MHAMKEYEEVDVWLHTFLTSAPDGGEWSASGTGRFTSEELVPCASSTGRRMGPRATLNALKNRKIFPLPNIEPRFFCRPASSSVAIQTEISLI
jgi:hypothetical protein